MLETSNVMPVHFHGALAKLFPLFLGHIVAD
jgi:hypothetical protein